jgi:hypothetical protein
MSKAKPTPLTDADRIEAYGIIREIRQTARYQLAAMWLARLRDGRLNPRNSSPRFDLPSLATVCSGCHGRVEFDEQTLVLAVDDAGYEVAFKPDGSIYVSVSYSAVMRLAHRIHEEQRHRPARDWAALIERVDARIAAELQRRRTTH